MATDISRNTIFVLVILTLLVSVLGMWTVLDQVNAGPTINAPSSGQSSGQVQLVIEEPPTPSYTGATGQIVFNIENPGR